MQSFFRLLANRPLQILVLLLAVALVYADSMPASFHFDDVFILQDPAILHGQFAADLNGTRYLTQLSFALNYALCGADPVSFHAVNLALHGLMALLVYLLVHLLLTRAPETAGYRTYVPFLVALLFAVHPIETGAVDYASQRATLLAALFYVGCAVLYIAARMAERVRPRWLLWIASLIACLAAMRCKENSFTLPFAVILTDFLIMPRSGLRGRWPAFAFLLLLPVIPLSHLDVMQDAATGITAQTAAISRAAYLMTESHVALTYLRLLLIPVGQTLDYDYPVTQSLDLLTLCALLFHLILIGLCAVTFWKRERVHPLLVLAAFGGLWFYLTLAVESSFIPIKDVINEYRLYLPSVGFFLAAVSAAAYAYSKLPARAWKPAAALMLSVGAVAALGTATYARNPVWHDEVSLWSDVVQKAPHKARGHNDLALAYMTGGDLTRAEQEFMLAAQYDPKDVTIQLNLSDAYEKDGRLPQALTTLQRAAARFPGDAVVHAGLGDLYVRAEQPDLALQEYQRALELDPRNTVALFDSGLVLMQLHRYDQACNAFGADYALQPEAAWARYYEAVCKISEGDRQDGVRILTELEREQPDFAPAAELLRRMR